MSSLRNTLFMRLMDQRDAKAAAEQQAQQGAIAKTGALANTASSMEQQSRGQNQQLAQGLGAAAGASGQPMPEMEDPRMAQYAEVGYAPADAQFDRNARLDKAASSKNEQAALFQSLKFEYEKQKASGKAAIDLRDSNSRAKLAQAAMIRARRTGGAGGKQPVIPADDRKEINKAEDVIDSITVLEQTSPQDAQRYLTLAYRGKSALASGANVLGMNGAANALVDPEDRAKYNSFTAAMASLRAPEAQRLFGANKGVQEMVDYFQALPSGTQDFSRYNAITSGMRSAATKRILNRTEDLTQGPPTTVDEINRRAANRNSAGAPAPSAAPNPQSLAQYQQLWQQAIDQGMDEDAADEAAAEAMGL